MVEGFADYQRCYEHDINCVAASVNVKVEWRRCYVCILHRQKGLLHNALRTTTPSLYVFLYYFDVH